MTMIKTGVVLSLLCGIAFAAWGPTDLVVDIGDTKGDFVDLKLQWNAGSCPFAKFHIFLEAPHTTATEVGQTSEPKFIIENQEFWTKYIVTLKTSNCLVNSNLTSEIVTGPGNPHKVAGIVIETSATAANLTVEEAHMPRIVDLYNVTYCSPVSCKTQIIARNEPNPLETPIFIKTSLKPLIPDTIYNISVASEIFFEDTRYRGEPMVAVFRTKK